MSNKPISPKKTVWELPEDFPMSWRMWLISNGGRERTFKQTTVGDTIDGRPGWLNTPVWVEVTEDE